LLDGPLDVAQLNTTGKSILLKFVARSLMSLHSRAIAHLDPKPANTLMKGQRALIGDFGSPERFCLFGDSDGTAITVKIQLVSHNSHRDARN
jgi:serine/threonine protein kinase